MNTALFNTGLLLAFFGALLMFFQKGRQRQGEVSGEYKGFKFKIRGREGFVFMALGFLTMIVASYL